MLARGLVIASAVALGTLVVSAALATGGSLTPLQWDQASQGLPVLTVAGREVWIDSIAVNPAHSVYRVDPDRVTVSPTPLDEQFQDLFPGEGALWASALATAQLRLRLYWIDIAHGFHLEEKEVPANCEFSDGGHSAVWGGRLWLTCSRYGVYTFTPRSRKSVQALQLRSVRALLPASNGLWAARKNTLRGIAGISTGVVLSLPRGFVVDGDYASNVGWAVTGTTVWAVGYGLHGPELVRLDLRHRKVSTFPVVVPGLSAAQFLGQGVAIARHEILVADSQHLRIVRYSARRPGRPIGSIPLPGQWSKDADVILTGGAGVAWVTVHDPTNTRLYRITVAP
jgi:hypothetical protein